MTSFLSALWAEFLKVRRSKVLLLTSLGFSFFAFVDAFFMIILTDPGKAQRIGLIGAKARILAETADWPSFWTVLLQGSAVAEIFLFAVVASWIFGREFSDRTAKDLLALPTPRSTILSAKFVMIVVWGFALILFVYLLSLGLGVAIGLPGWSNDLAWRSFIQILAISGMNLALMSPVALLASAGRGYLPPLGWTILTIFLAQIVAAIGWGAWFPWSIPALYSGEAGSSAEALGIQSAMLILITFTAGLIGTYLWWYRADHVR